MCIKNYKSILWMTLGLGLLGTAGSFIAQYGYGGGETAAGYTSYSITNGQASGASMTGPGNAPYTKGNSAKLGRFGIGGT